MTTNMCTGMAHRSLRRLCCCAFPDYVDPTAAGE